MIDIVQPPPRQSPLAGNLLNLERFPVSILGKAVILSMQSKPTNGVSEGQLVDIWPLGRSHPPVVSWIPADCVPELFDTESTDEMELAFEEGF